MALKIVDADQYLSARDKAEKPSMSFCTPLNVRTLTNSSAFCFTSEDGAAGFYLMPDGFPRGTFGLGSLPPKWLVEARALRAAKLQ